MTALIGSHIASNIDQIISETDRIYNLGGNIVQLFVNAVGATNERDKIYNKFTKKIMSKKMTCVVHISYTVNCSQNWDYHSWWIKQLIIEINYATKLGAPFVVIHLGKQLNLSIEEALNNMYTSLLYVHKQTSNSTRILIETSTGQGSEICYSIEDLAHFYKKISNHNNDEIKNRFGICLDTCHIFASGYDISNKSGIDQYFSKFNKLIGIKHIKLVHLNDSKKECGSKVDRHENIGKGFIGETSLLLIKNMFMDLGVPIVLETPISGQQNDFEIILK